MITIAVNLRDFLAVLGVLTFVCVIGLILTDRTDATYNFMHYVLYIATFSLVIWMTLIIVIFVGAV